MTSTEEKKSRGIYWILFLVTFIGFFVGLVVFRHYAWIVFPFPVTFLAVALDMI